MVSSEPLFEVLIKYRTSHFSLIVQKLLPAVQRNVPRV